MNNILKKLEKIKEVIFKENIARFFFKAVFVLTYLISMLILLEAPIFIVVTSFLSLIFSLYYVFLFALNEKLKR